MLSLVVNLGLCMPIAALIYYFYVNPDLSSTAWILSTCVIFSAFMGYLALFTDKPNDRQEKNKKSGQYRDFFDVRAIFG